MGIDGPEYRLVRRAAGALFDEHVRAARGEQDALAVVLEAVGQNVAQVGPEGAAVHIAPGRVLAQELAPLLRVEAGALTAPALGLRALPLISLLLKALAVRVIALCPPVDGDGRGSW